MKRILNIIYNLLVGVLIIIALLLVLTAFPISDYFKLYVVQSGSMAPAIKTGSIVVSIPDKDYKVNDIVTYRQTNDSSTVTHRIYEIKNNNGQLFFITKGDANHRPDNNEVSRENILGKVKLSVPFVGYAIDMAKKPLGFAVIIIIPALILIFDEIKKIIQEIKKIKAKKQKDLVN